MAEPTLDSVGQWLLDNKDKAGSPDFVTMSNAYREMAQPPAAAPASGDAPGINDDIRKVNARDPYNWDNTINRTVTGAVTGIPDTLIAIGNAAMRAAGDGGSLGMAGVAPGSVKQAPYLGPKMLAAGGGVPLPDDASWGRQITEGAGSTLLGGGAGAVKSAITNAPSWIGSIVPAARALFSSTVAPTVTSNTGGRVGGAVGGETGALLGSLLGGAATNAGPAAKSYVYNRFAGQGKPDAPQIAAAAARQGIPTTAGMLGNPDIQQQERQLAAKPGAMAFINTRRQGSIDAIGDALNRIATARGSTDMDPTPASIGQRVTEAAGETAQALRNRSEEGQLRLQDRIGADTPVPVTPLREQGYSMMTDPRAGLSVPGRQAIDYRLTDQLSPLINRDTAGQPIMQGAAPSRWWADGPNPGGSETVPYGPFRGWRTDLGKSLDTPQGGRMPPTAELYAPATEAMRGVAEQQGVPRQDFENVQGRTRAVERSAARPGDPTGDYEHLMGVAGREPQSAYSYLHGGLQNPDRLGMLEATQHPQVPGIMGDYLRLLGNQTLGKGDARGPINLADRLSAPKMDPRALDVIAGPHEPAVRDVATAARAVNYPTSQTGLTRAIGGVGDSLVNKLIGSEAFGKAGELIGAGNTAGRIVGLGAGPVYHYLQGRLLQSQTARDALAGRPQAPGAALDINRLRAALIAANAGRQAGE